MLGAGRMKPRIALLALAVIVGAGWCGYLRGWYAHSEHINQLAGQKNAAVTRAIQVGEEKAADANAAARVIYKTVYRDVVKYVESPAHSVCEFDPAAVQLRQRAIDAANHIPGFDAPTVQNQ